jgi:Ca2+-binding RTX toxin-like protein
MAIATAYYPTSMDTTQTWYGYVTKATSTQIQITSGNYVQNYFGSGFQYANNQVVGGTVTSTNYYEFGKKIYGITGGSYSAATVANYVLSGDANGLLTYVFQGNDTFNGSAYIDILNGYAGNDLLKGNAGNDILSGGAGNDTLDGGAGTDTMLGGADNDTYVVDNASDTVTEATGEGTDLVKVAIASANGSYTLSGNIENATLTNTVAFTLTGNELDNILTGNATANTLNGGDGNDTLDGGKGIDTLNGGAGNDTYIVDVAGDAITDTAGTDTVIAKLVSGTYTLASGLENLTLFGTTAINGTGNSDANTITGNKAANVLDGQGGADLLIGGTGGDTYVVDNTGDVVQETSSLSTEIDTVKSGITYSLSNTSNGNQLAYVEKLTLTGSADINGTGNARANTITGNTGANTLDGGAGVDTLIGGAGNDTYIVDLTAAGALQDKVTETSTTDTGDTLLLRGASTNATAVTRVLATPLENLDASATGTSKLNLTGNVSANTLTGNDANNVLSGLAGNDTIHGRGGNDILDGGVGSDSLIGGTGDDTYVVDNAGDTITEGSGEGTDLVKVGIATAGGTFTLSGNVENATLTNTVAFNLTGNELGNVLTGNAAANTLNGGIGNDLILGKLGNDILTGGAGNDIFRFDTKPSSSANVDTITDFGHLEDLIQLENGIFTKLTATGSLSDANFVAGNGVAADANDYVLYNTTSGNLYYDADGSGAGAAVQFATLTGHPTLTAADFMVI